MSDDPILLEFGAKLPLFDDLPPHEAIVTILGGKAQRLGDLALHKDDLAFAMECLEALRPMATTPDSTVARSLWMSAIVTFMKCFGDSKSRSQLSETKVFKGPDSVLALEAFAFFKELRHRHYVHDNNSCMRVHIGAVVNLPNESKKVHSIVSLTERARLIEQGNYGSLHNLVRVAHAWVLKEHEELGHLLQAELEAETRETLLSRQSIHRATVPPPDRSASRPRI